MIELVDKLLDEFVSRFEEFYGLENMSCNLHQLRHLAEVVRRTGPLWTMSCFSLENLNGKLAALVHSSNSAQLQICKGLPMYMSLYIMKRDLCRPNSKILQLIDKILSVRRIKLNFLSASIAVVGKLITPTNVEEVSHILKIIVQKKFIHLNNY